MQNIHQTVPSAPIPTITHNKQFFTGLASLFSHAHALSNPQLNNNDKEYLLSCANAACLTLGNIQKAFALLVYANNHTDKAYQADIELIESASFDLMMLSAELQPLLHQISQELNPNP